MRIAIVGQKDFGKAALDAFLKRGDTVAGVFCAPEKPGEAADALREAAEQAGVPVFALPSLRVEEARQALQSLNVDIAILAFVLQFVPQDFATIPRHGTIQFHPSLLPRYRGPSSINWPIILGDTRTGLSIFRPVDGLDEGPVILQKETPIGPDETVGKVYFEGWCRDPEAQINWHTHVEQVYNLIRGCDPAPGAWTLFNQKRLQLYDARKHSARTFSQVKGRIGAITSIGEQSLSISAQGGQIEVFKLRYDGGKKLPAPQFCAESGLCLGTILGT